MTEKHRDGEKNISIVLVYVYSSGGLQPAPGPAINSSIRTPDNRHNNSGTSVKR